MLGIFAEKRMVWLTVLLLTVTMFLGTITYADNKEPQVRELSLQQATELAAENNYDIKLAKLDVKSADKNYDVAKKNASDLKLDFVQTYELGVVKWVMPRQAEAGLTLAEEKEKLTGKRIKLEVEGAYYDVLKTQKLLQIRQDTLKYANDQLKIIQDSLKLGTAAQGDVMAVEAMVAGSEAAVTQSQNDYNLAVMKLNELIGLDIDTPLKLTGKFEFLPMDKIDVNSEVYKALENNIAIILVKEEQAVKEKEYEVANKFLGGGVLVYETSKIAAEAAEVKVKQQEVATRLAVKQDYMTIQSMEKFISQKQKEAEKQKEVLRITMLKYKAGLATNQDVKKATLDYESAELSLTETVFAHNQLKSKFKYGLFGGGAPM